MSGGVVAMLGLGRRAKRIAKISFSVVVAYCVLHVLLIVCPPILFWHHRTYKQFTVYMREPVPDQITDVLDRVESRLAQSTINDADREYRIVLVNSFRLSRYLLLRNVHFGCNPTIGPIFITNADVVNDVSRCEKISPDDQRVRTLTGAIGHEIVHGLIVKHVGWWGNRRLPVWVKEGYCEFIAQGSAIDFDTGVSLMKNGYGYDTPGLAYFKYRLVMAYLINDQQMTIDEILQRPPDYGPIEAEVVAALRADEEGFLRRVFPEGTGG